MVIICVAGRVVRLKKAGASVRGVPAWLVATALLAASGTVAAAPLGYQEALNLAEQRSSLLLARQASLDGARQGRLAAGQLPDPKLSVGVENYPISGMDRFSWNRDSMTMRRVGVMQDVPNAARRAAQREASEARTEREQALLVADRLAVRRETALAWLAQHYAERKLHLFASLEQENKLLQDTLAARIAAGKAMPAEALMARQEALGLVDRRDELRTAAEQARASVERWTGVASEATAPGSPVIPLEPASLMRRLDRHAELLPAVPMLAIARADMNEAQASRRGDWSWEVAYANRARAYGDMVSFQLTFDLPVSPSTRQEPQVTAKRKEVERLEAEREDALRRLRAELQAQVSELQRLERALERQAGEAVPLAGERVRLTLASYEGGRADLGNVLAARRDAAEAQWRALDLESQLMSLRARLAYLIAE